MAASLVGRQMPSSEEIDQLSCAQPCGRLAGSTIWSQGKPALQIPMAQAVEKTVDKPQLQVVDKTAKCQVMEKTMELPQLQSVDKSHIQVRHSGSGNIAHEPTVADRGKIYEIQTVLKAPPDVEEHVQPAPVA